MKYQITFIILLISLITETGYAQKKSIYLLDDFTQGVVLMKNGAKTNALLNYDGSNRKMKFKQQDEIMILTNTQAIDTVFIASHKFIPYSRKGRQGAYGYANQSTTTTSINTSFYNKGYYKVENPDIMEEINDNDYWFFRTDKPVKFRNEKSLLKLFPGKEELIRIYIKEHNINMKNPEQVIELSNYCMGL